jgi:hypothetical protein
MIPIQSFPNQLMMIWVLITIGNMTTSLRGEFDKPKEKRNESKIIAFIFWCLVGIVGVVFTTFNIT